MRAGDPAARRLHGVGPHRFRARIRRRVAARPYPGGECCRRRGGVRPRSTHRSRRTAARAIEPTGVVLPQRREIARGVIVPRWPPGARRRWTASRRGRIQSSARGRRRAVWRPAFRRRKSPGRRRPSGRQALARWERRPGDRLEQRPGSKVGRGAGLSVAWVICSSGARLGERKGAKGDTLPRRRGRRVKGRREA